MDIKYVTAEIYFKILNKNCMLEAPAYAAISVTDIENLKEITGKTILDSVSKTLLETLDMLKIKEEDIVIVTRDEFIKNTEKEDNKLTPQKDAWGLYGI